ncbi:MAG: pyridoxal phosphate-dependent decarboxylase family protein, partial [Ilumatobacteraceae bacterium]
MHTPDAAMSRLARLALTYSFERIHMDPPPLDAPMSYDEMHQRVGRTITPNGIGGEALRLFMDVLAPACISVDHPTFLSFVPGAPTEASVIFDMVVSASGIYTGSWLEGAGAVYAENEALRWIADLAEFPASAGGAFVSGGTAGNLSALIAARHRWRERAEGRADRLRGLVVASEGAHSSVKQAARAMDADVVAVEADANGRLVGERLRAAIDALPTDDRARVFAVVATGGTTNLGV